MQWLKIEGNTNGGGGCSSLLFTLTVGAQPGRGKVSASAVHRLDSAPKGEAPYREGPQHRGKGREHGHDIRSSLLSGTEALLAPPGEVQIREALEGFIAFASAAKNPSLSSVNHPRWACS